MHTMRRVYAAASGISRSLAHTIVAPTAATTTTSNAAAAGVTLTHTRGLCGAGGHAAAPSAAFTAAASSTSQQSLAARFTASAPSPSPFALFNPTAKSSFVLASSSSASSSSSSSSSLFAHAVAPQLAVLSRHTHGPMPRRLFGDDVWDLSKKLRRYKPVSPGLRHLVEIDRGELWRGRPVRALTKGGRGKDAGAGRGRGNGRSRGKITVRHRGGGHKKLYRYIDFKRAVYDVPALVQRLEYDPNRTAYIALIRYETGELSYILAPHDLRPGDTVISSRANDVDIAPGNAMPLGAMPIGTTIHNLETRPGKGGQLARVAGGSAQLLSKHSRPGYCLVRLASKEERLVLLQCLATVGSLSNPLHNLRQLGKAGRARHMGYRPRTRGVAMNPVDHPMGGGEGKSSGGRAPCSPTGVLAKGFKTRSMRRKNKLIVKHVPDSRHRHMGNRL